VKIAFSSDYQGDTRHSARARAIFDGGRSLNSSAWIEPGSPNVRASIEVLHSAARRCHQSDAARLLHLSHSQHRDDGRTFIEPGLSCSIRKTDTAENSVLQSILFRVRSNRPRFSCAEEGVNVAKPYASGLVGVNAGMRARARDASIARRNPPGSGEIIYVNPL